MCGLNLSLSGISNEKPVLQQRLIISVLQFFFTASSPPTTIPPPTTETITKEILTTKSDYGNIQFQTTTVFSPVQITDKGKYCSYPPARLCIHTKCCLHSRWDHQDTWKSICFLFAITFSSHSQRYQSICKWLQVPQCLQRAYFFFTQLSPFNLHPAYIPISLILGSLHPWYPVYKILHQLIWNFPYTLHSFYIWFAYFCRPHCNSLGVSLNNLLPLSFYM